MEIQGHGLAGAQRESPVQPADALRASARAFEAAFLSEMLRAAGAGQSAGPFGGGIGEDQFASFLLDHQAERIAARGGLGLAEIILRSLMSESGGTR